MGTIIIDNFVYKGSEVKQIDLSKRQLVEIERERQLGTNNGTDMRKKGECREGYESLEKISAHAMPNFRR